MTKLKKAIHLDYITVKPYFTVKNLLIYSVMALFLTTMSDNIASGIGVGLMIATLFVSYPFALCEKSNLDAFYTTLSLNRKTVVLGRYLFTLLLNICAVLFSFILATAGLLTAKVAGFSSGIGGEGYLESTLLLSAIFILIQAIQLPVFFKLGYTKAKILSVVPFAVLMAGYMALMAMQNISTGLANTLEILLVSGLFIPLILIIMVAIVIISYGLSVAFYKKREF